MITVNTSYGRLGNLLATGSVRDRDIFPHIQFSVGAIEHWEKVKHLYRGDDPAINPFSGVMFIELLAARAEAYLAREGVKRFGTIPFFDSDPSILETVRQQVAQARALA